jgi:CMP-N-acetylneuraminate monooxygenase
VNRGEVLRVPYDSIPEGSSTRSDIIFYREGENVTAASNRCRHQGGTMVFEEDCFVCPRHNWQLNPKTMQYISPDGLDHPTFEVAHEGLDLVVISESVNHPWTLDFREPANLKVGELIIRFLAHACAEFLCGRTKLITDPWLVGPAFTRGWWLAHDPPSDWLESLAGATAIYISHNHSDHLNFHTLNRLAEVNPLIPIFIPNFGSSSCEQLIRRAGMKNVTHVPFGQWVNLDEEMRFMLLRDTAGREDSGILIDYRGHLILNTVDCSNLNNGDLPSKVDVLLAPFAGGASGYPVCWPELYSDEEIEKVVARNRAAVLARLRETLRTVNPSYFVPFAGYFVEAHPGDEDIRLRNGKNSPERAIDLAESFEGTKGWLPHPGATLDVATGLSEGVEYTKRSSWDNEFSMYIPPIDDSLNFIPLKDLRGVQRYFEWTGFHGDLVLHVIEMDEYLKQTLREFYVDFRGVSISSKKPAGQFRYLRMKVRATSFRHVLKNGEPWEEISIGFQGRFFREPDRYNFDFWDHMQNSLPVGTPWEHPYL